MSTSRLLGRPRASSRRRYCRPPEQATRSRPGELSGPGSTAALRMGSRGPCIPRPAHRSGLAGLPAGGRHASTPVGPSPSGRAQANCCTQLHTGGEPGQASTDPTRPQRARPAGVARPKGVCPGWAGNDASMVMLRRIGRRRAAGVGPMVRAFGEPEPAPRTAVPPSSRYNPARRCAIHQGWDRQRVTRPRRPHP